MSQRIFLMKIQSVQNAKFKSFYEVRSQMGNIESLLCYSNQQQNWAKISIYLYEDVKNLYFETLNFSFNYPNFGNTKCNQCKWLC